MFKNNIIFDGFVIEFSALCPPNVEPTSHSFHIFEENVNFAEIVLPSWLELHFPGFGLPKIKKNPLPLVAPSPPRVVGRLFLWAGRLGTLYL